MNRIRHLAAGSLGWALVLMLLTGDAVVAQGQQVTLSGTPIDLYRRYIQEQHLQEASANDDRLVFVASGTAVWISVSRTPPPPDRLWNPETDVREDEWINARKGSGWYPVDVGRTVEYRVTWQRGDWHFWISAGREVGQWPGDAERQRQEETAALVVARREAMHHATRFDRLAVGPQPDPVDPVIHRIEGIVHAVHRTPEGEIFLRPEALYVGRAVPPGMRFVIEPGGKIWIRHPDGTLVCFGPGPTEFIRPPVERPGPGVPVYRLFRGLGLFILPPDRPEPAGRFEAETNSVRTGVRGTVFRLLHDDRTSITTIQVARGSVEARPTNPALAPFTLNAGQQAHVGPAHVSAVSAYTPEPGTIDPPGTPGPRPATAGMHVEAEHRRVSEGEIVRVPVWLRNATDVANMNLEVHYDAAVARPEGEVIKGNMLDRAIFSANPRQAGRVRIGFAQTSGLSGTGTVASLPLRAVGRPGSRTLLRLEVTTADDPDGSPLTLQRIDGSITIVGPGGQVPGDCDGDGDITPADAMCALKMSVGSMEEMPHLDVDGDGRITSSDARILLRRSTM